MPRASTARTPATRPDPLARCVGDPGRFAAEHWGRRPHIHRGDDLLVDVFSIDGVDALLASTARRPEVRLVRDGEPVPPARWSGPLRLGGRWVDDVVDPAAVARELAGGATVVLQSLHRTVPSVGRFAGELEAQVSHPVQVNAYLTPPGAAGLAPHADGHHVLAVQLHGTKRWWVDGLGDLELDAGDCLYLPAGTRHSAATGEATSLHLTIGIMAATYRQAVQRLLERKAAELDAPLPLGYARADDDQLGDGLVEALDVAAKALAGADPAAVAAAERRRRRPRARPDGHLASVVALDGLDADTVVQLRAGPVPALRDEPDGRLRLDLGTRVVHLPAGAGPALRLLLDGERCRVGDLPDLTPASQVVVARRLVVEGMLRLVAWRADLWSDGPMPAAERPGAERVGPEALHRRPEVGPGRGHRFDAELVEVDLDSVEDLAGLDREGPNGRVGRLPLQLDQLSGDGDGRGEVRPDGGQGSDE